MQFVLFDSLFICRRRVANWPDPVARKTLGRGPGEFRCRIERKICVRSSQAPGHNGVHLIAFGRLRMMWGENDSQFQFETSSPGQLIPGTDLFTARREGPFNASFELADEAGMVGKR